jgi:cobalt-zinc-cadmium efflux system membrane fusion protein
MKPIICLLLLQSVPIALAAEGPTNRLANTVVLDEPAVKNLRIETVEAEETDFTETIFALGRIDVLPGKKGVVSSRVAGRVHSVVALPDMISEAGDELLWIESRQAGDPPPIVRLDAPIAGTIAEVKVAVGQPVEPGDSLIEIYDLQTVEAIASVPEHLAGRLAKGQKAEIRVPGFPDTVFETELVHLGVHANAASGTIEAAFHVANADGRLRPGLRAEFSIIVGQRENVMSIPREALQGDPANRFVYVKDYDLPHAFVKTPIVLGAQNDRAIEVTQGLLPGDEVVTSGAYSLAFAGKGSVSLREALDAAHGHPHNDDGTEMTKEQIASLGAEGGGGGAHAHGPTSGNALFWQIASGVLALMLVLSVLKRGQPVTS